MKSRWATVAGIVAVMFITVGAAYQSNYGKVAPQDATLDGGVGAPLPTQIVTVSGTLVDAGCQNRSQENLVSSPTPRSGIAPAQPPQQSADMQALRSKVGFAGKDVQPQAPTMTAFGITVDKQTLDQEQSDVIQHQSPDLYTRQPDASCAITGNTKAFALLTDKGRLLDLDAGGNTFAWQAVQSTDAGSALLNGTGSSFKPHATVKGTIWADQLIVQSFSW